MLALEWILSKQMRLEVAALFYFFKAGIGRK